MKVSEERTKRSHISHVPLWRNPSLLMNVLSSSVMNRTLNLPTVGLHPPQVMRQSMQDSGRCGNLVRGLACGCM